MTKEYVSLLSFMMRIDEFTILDLLKFLDFWLDHRVSSIWIDRFSLDLTSDD